MVRVSLKKGLVRGSGSSPCASAASALVGLAAPRCCSSAVARPSRRARSSASPCPSRPTKEPLMLHACGMWAWLAAMLTGIIVWGLIFYACIRFRRRSENEIPVQTRYNLPIEIFYTIAPIMMVIVFFYFTVQTQDKVLNDEKNPDQTRHGRGPAVVLDLQLQPRVRPGSRGSCRRRAGCRPRGRHDGGPPDAVAGQGQERRRSTSTRPTSSTRSGCRRSCSRWTSSPAATTTSPSRPTREGTFDGRCAELCGVYHSRMLFNVKVVDQAEYDAHLQDLAATGQHRPRARRLGGRRKHRAWSPRENGGAE